MALEFNMNVDEDNPLPFADCDSLIEPKTEKNVSTNEKIERRKPKSKIQVEKPNEFSSVEKFLSKCYFENAEKENTNLTLISYTGPCNTNHLDRQLYLPQIESKRNVSTSSDEIEKFLNDFDEIFQSTKSLPDDIVVRKFIRVGIFYLIRAESIANENLSIKDFHYYRNRGRPIKTSFYTCKGVTSPKRLTSKLNKLNYRSISSNRFTYDIQLYLDRNRSNFVLHFQLDEDFRCRTVSHHPTFPSNFDFIRDKSTSRFSSIDESFADMFDFRVQLTYTKYLEKTDPIVKKILHNVSIDEILFADKTSEVLRIAPELRRNVKYLKCNRSNQYENVDEQILISIGSYEEYRWNPEGVCQSLMKAENMMTIEMKSDSPQKIYDVGHWFSTLCQNSVELSLTTNLTKNLKTSSRWFSAMAIFARKYNKTTKQINVEQLTTYRRTEKNRTCTIEDMSWVRNLLQEDDLKKFFTDSDGKMLIDRKEIDQKFNSITKRLETISTPSSKKALKRVFRAYRRVCQEFDASRSSTSFIVE